MAEGAAEMYVAQLGQLRSLSPAGSAQLAADLEYFCNVVSALGVSIPPALATWQVGFSTGTFMQGFQEDVSCKNLLAAAFEDAFGTGSISSSVLIMQSCKAVTTSPA